jgi:transglutaminase-like putative cysteine protease
MSFLRRFPLLAYTLVFLSLLAFNYAAENYGLLVFSLSAVLVSWWLVENNNGPPVPRWLINSAVLVVAMALFWELVIYQQSNLLLALGHFMVGLIICKLFEKKLNRDYGQILLLSLLLILSGAILTVSPVYAMILLVYLALGLYTSLVFHLQCETQRAMQRHAAGDRMMIMPGQQAVMARDMRRISIGAGLFLFVFACVIFILFPRTGMPGMLASWRIGGTTATGLTNHIQLGKFGQLQNSNAVVADVTITQDGQNIGSRGYNPYFMSSTEDFYNGHNHEWIHAPHFTAWQPIGFPGRRSRFFHSPRPFGTPGLRSAEGTRAGAAKKGNATPDVQIRRHDQRLTHLYLQRRKLWRQAMRRQARFQQQAATQHSLPKSIVLKRGIASHLVHRGTYGRSGLITQKYTFNNFRSGPLLAMCPAVSISSPDLQEVTRHSDGTIFSDPIRGNLSYTVKTPLKYNVSLLGPQHPKLFPTMYRESMFSFYSEPIKVQSSPIPKRVAAMAGKIAGPLLKIKRTKVNAEKVDMDLANRFCNYLQQHYAYSFDMTPVNANIDPTEDFLLNKKKIGGYCEYFASAMVMFCRSVGIPARIVSGFHGGDFNSVGGYYVIEEKYAHAWVQAFIPHRGWVRFDPSPVSSLTSVEGKVTWFTEVADFFQWLRLKWLHNIITFNQAMRKALINHIMTFAKAVMDTLRNYARTIANAVRQFCNAWAMDVWIKILMAMAAAGLIPLGVVIYSRWKRRSSVATLAIRAMDRKIQRRMMRELMFIDRLMKVLDRTGVTREADQTPREYVQAVGKETGLDLIEALRLVSVFYDIRFGSSRMSPQISGVIAQDLAATEQKIRQRPRGE